MEERRPKAGEKYRHFKNKLYQIVGIAKHSENGSELVIYQALYGDFGLYARPLDMFVSEVDHVKYPEVKQKYRFEHVALSENGQVVSLESEEAATSPAPASKEIATDATAPASSVPDDSETEGIHPLLMKFFDTDDLEERYKILVSMRDIVDDQMIDSMAVVCDLVIEDGPLTKRYDQLKSAIATRQKYEQANRLR